MLVGFGGGGGGILVDNFGPDSDDSDTRNDLRRLWSDIF